MRFYIWILIPVLLSMTAVEQDNNFLFIDQQGVEASTAQYDGHIVFISFWSKRCAPCIRSFRENCTLREDLMQAGVVMLNASIDDKDDWMAACEKYQPNGRNILIKDIQKTQRQFEIYSLPVYVTLDIHGNRIDYDPHLRGDIKDFADWFSKR